MAQRVVEDMPRKTFLFACMDSYGHLNSLIGLANYLKSKGHKTAFLFSSQFAVPGHDVYVISSLKPKDNNPDDDIPGEEKFKNLVSEFAKTFLLSPKDVQKYIFDTSFPVMFQAQIDDCPFVEKMLDEIKPDVVIADHLMVQPAIAAHPKYVRVQSATPLGIWHEYYPDKLPPEFYGLPTQSPKELVDEYKKFDRDLKRKFNLMIRGFCSEQYNLEVKDNAFNVESKLLNIYTYPYILDYADVCPDGLPDNWLQCDDLIRREYSDQKDSNQSATNANSFEVPESLRDKPGKLIFVSMGTLASMDVKLMKRLVSILSESPHRFIFSKGVCHNLYELNDNNMWGEKFVNQLEIIQNVDLIITHGGNNTITECLYYGIPGMIVCPLFGDQYDNAQRIQEKGLGIKLNPFHSTKDEFLEAIENLLVDDGLKLKMKEISQNMRKKDHVAIVGAKIERLAYDD